ncbi:transcription factor bHLH52-like [Primulina eburnea]|uniref:transcription factor bHLH52-like n=1 Tax=Primulina eburnea TaxID=1245227 RepID=UPI003C6C4188
MERESEFQIPRPDHTEEHSVGEAYINGVYEGLSFHTLLTYDPYGSSAPTPVTYGVFDVPAQTQNILVMPKSEPQPEISTFYGAFSTEAPPYNFFSDVASSSHHHLPGFLSLEQPRNTAVDSLSRVEDRRSRKQQKLSDKTRRLQKLLPWDKKMDMATVLEEACKYIKFLQAQVSILQAMPNTESGSHGTAISSLIHGVVGDQLGRLNRQQLLQVLLHSPIAQTMLYSNGCCVYSLEQLLLVKNNAERKAQFNQLLFDSNTNAWGPDYYRF